MKLSDPAKQPKVEKLDKDYADMKKGDRMLIATPAIVDSYVREIPKGKSVSMVTMRRDLAAMHDADNTCPLTTGIFLRIVAEASHDAIEHGTALYRVSPFWRVVEVNSKLNTKLSFGPGFVKERRKKERLDD